MSGTQDPSYRRARRFGSALFNRGVPLGLALAIAGVLGLAILAYALLSGPSDSVSGTVVALGLTETETGSYPAAVVQLPSGRVSVGIPRANDCRVGRPIRLIRVHHHWGDTFQPGSVPC